MTTVDFSEIYAYLDYLRQHGRHETTLHTYECILKRTVTALAESGRPASVGQIGEEDVAWLFGHLDVAESARLSYVKALSRMSTHFGGPDWIKSLDILINRETPRRIFISIDQYGDLLQHADPTTRMILILGGCMGLRRAEIAGLLDTDIHGSTMTVRGKGHGPDGLISELPIPEVVQNEITRYRIHKRARGRDSGDGHLVQCLTHGTWSGVKVNAIGRRVSEVGDECGIEVTTHSLRRLYATTLYDADTDLNTLRILMRHSKVETTLQCYVEADPRRQQTAIAGMSKLMSSALGLN